MPAEIIHGQLVSVQIATLDLQKADRRVSLASSPLYCDKKEYIDQIRGKRTQSTKSKLTNTHWVKVKMRFFRKLTPVL